MAKAKPNLDQTGAAGVYQIICVSNGKLYIGSTAKSFKKRWGIHVCHLRKGKHHSRHLQAVWNKYGEENFKFEILEICDPQDSISREQYYIDLHKSQSVLMNMSPTARSALGCKHSDEARLKNSLRNKGKKLDAKTREAIRKGHLGMKYSPEHCEAIRRSKIGKKLPHEWRKSITEGQKRRQARERQERFQADCAAFGEIKALEMQRKRDATYTRVVRSRIQRNAR